MELLEAIKGRRSVRKYQDRQVPRELLEKILEEARWAPSNANQQQWHLLVVTGPRRDELVEVIGRANRYLRLKLQENFPDKPHLVESTLAFFRDLGGAPVVVLIYIPRVEKPDPATATDYQLAAYEFERKTNTEAAAAVTYNLTLLAYQEGLGTCWMTGPTYVEKEINELMGIEGEELIAIVPIGYPAQTPRTPPRKGNPITWVGFD